jgi:hypothetical protein
VQGRLGYNLGSFYKEEGNSGNQEDHRLFFQRAKHSQESLNIIIVIAGIVCITIVFLVGAIIDFLYILFNIIGCESSKSREKRLEFRVFAEFVAAAILVEPGLRRLLSSKESLPPACTEV